MYTHSFPAAQGHDDLVIEEFDRTLVPHQAPLLSHCYVTQLSATTDVAPCDA
ncbi:hypothetical protein RB200_11405 [Streptomyces sp. PmtG]